MAYEIDIANLPAATAVLDGDGTLLHANDAWRELARKCGADEDAIESLAWLANGSEIAAQLREWPDGGSAPARLEWQTTGSHRGTLQAGRTGDGPSLRLVCVMHDHDPDPGQLPAGLLTKLSHDIRTPLNAVLGFSRLIGEHPDLAPALKEHADAISDGSRRLQRKLNDYVEIVRSFSGGPRSRADAFRLLDLVGEVLRTRDEQSTISVVDDGGMADTIIGDEQRVCSLLRHMVLCAESDRASRAVLSTRLERRRGGSALLSLQLRPCGPAEADADFEGNPDRNRHPAAVNLGFCQQLARFLGGDARVREGPDSIRTLIITVMIDAQAPVEDEAMAPRQPQGVGKLDPAVQSALRHALENGDLDAIRQRLPQIRAVDPQLAAQFETLIDRFDYTGLERMLAV